MIYLMPSSLAISMMTSALTFSKVRFGTVSIEIGARVSRRLHGFVRCLYFVLMAFGSHPEYLVRIRVQAL